MPLTSALRRGDLQTCADTSRTCCFLSSLRICLDFGSAWILTAPSARQGSRSAAQRQRRCRKASLKLPFTPPRPRRKSQRVSPTSGPSSSNSGNVTAADDLGGRPEQSTWSCISVAWAFAPAHGVLGRKPAAESTPRSAGCEGWWCIRQHCPEIQGESLSLKTALR